MKNRKRRTKIILLLVLLLAVTVGFALLSTTLKINGFSHVSKATWKVHWDNVDNETGVTASTPAYIKDEKKTIVEYEVMFNEPGEYYEFTVDAVNEGTIDAEITLISSTVNGANISTLPPYIKYSIVYADNNEQPKNGDVLAKETSRTYKIHVEYDRDAVTNDIINDMEDDETYVFAFEVKYSQKAKEPSMARDSWATIVSNIRNNPEHYPLGDTKKVDIDINGNGTIDSDEHFHVRIINRTTPEECSEEGFSQTACGVVLDFVEVLTYHNMNPYDTSGQTVNQGNGVGNIGGWEYSEGRAFLNSTVYERENVDFATTGIYNKLPSDLKAVIIDTFVVSSHNDLSTSNFETTDKIYLPATKEVYGKEGTQVIITGDTSDPYTRQFDYYKSVGLSTNPDTYGPDKKKYKGSYSVWSMRSVYINPVYPGNTFEWYGVWANSGGWSNQGSLGAFMSPVFRIG